MSGRLHVQLNMEIDEATAEALQSYATAHGCDNREAVRRLVGYGAFVAGSLDAGLDVLTHDPKTRKYKRIEVRP